VVLKKTKRNEKALPHPMGSQHQRRGREADIPERLVQEDNMALLGYGSCRSALTMKPVWQLGKVSIQAPDGTLHGLASGSMGTVFAQCVIKGMSFFSDRHDT
jgi:hypothetical protein